MVERSTVLLSFTLPFLLLAYGFTNPASAQHGFNEYDELAEFLEETYPAFDTCEDVEDYLICSNQCSEELRACHERYNPRRFLEDCYNSCRQVASWSECGKMCILQLEQSPNFLACSWLGIECNLNCYREHCMR